ncbi:MAG: hypothetical protein LW875_11605 [Proteobacteria bacterium]|nr:hypothetical protein [Pseudomonadota bacterium]
MPLRHQFISFLRDKYSGLSHQDLEAITAEHLLSPFKIELPKTVLSQAQEFVGLAYAYSHTDQARQRTQKELQKKGLKAQSNASLFMSYDFHLGEDGVLKLIEINTNAAFYFLGSELYEFRKLPQPVSPDPVGDLFKDIENEFNLLGYKAPSQMKLQIVDESPTLQRLYLEFLVAKNWFESRGHHTEICDRTAATNCDFIYNRSTDFFFEEPASKGLRDLYNQGMTLISPQPAEYFALADKERMIEWQSTPLKKYLPPAFLLSPETVERAWAERKNLFFKPTRAFGSKMTYKGASIARKAFESMDLNGGAMAQGLVPAPEIERQTPKGPQKFKYDLRIYAYQNEVRSVIARVYQGQVTNLKTEWGGFCPVLFKEL